MKQIVIVFMLAIQIWAAGSGARPRQTSKYTVGSSIQPFVIYGDGWSQQITIINVDYYKGGESTIGSLRFFTGTGQPWKIPLKGTGSTDAIAIRLSPGQMVTMETEPSDQTQQLGWALLDISLAPGSGGIYHAFSSYRKQSPGGVDVGASASFVDDFEDEAIIPIDTAGAKSQGIGLVNNGRSSGTFRLDVYDSNGGLRKTINKTVGAQQLAWFSLVDENPELNGMVGQIKVRGPQFHGAAVATLQYLPDGGFTFLPIVHTFGMP